MYLRWRKDRMTMTIRDLDDSLNDYKRDQILFNGEKIREIFQEARKIKEAQQDFQRECQEMEKQREEGRNQTDRENPESPEIEELQEEGKKKKDGAELWARKYAPQGYADLLSDDAVNRNSITWLRLWDECVFKRRHTVQAIESRLNDRERMTFSMENRFGNRARRPHFKILLLTGPAGSGKTTLAGAIARLCGYATVELNASDSRNAPDFEKAIDGALRNQYTIDNGNKPNCLILDEIDGAPADAIKFLARTIQGTGKKAIKRPIIAICNSLFTTSLRELRPLCLVLNVNAMRRERLVERLQKIAQIENVNIDTFSLEKLVELTECDVRSSLNTLQLLANSNQGKRITAKQVEQAAESSVQNANKSLFEAFSMVLEFSRHLDNKGHLFSMKQRLQRIERVAIDQGDDRFVAGLHANYTAVNLPIGTLNRAANTFTFWDTINQKARFF
ncbi:hypothetical protein WR25_25649 isoform B [Diploscapter pachys]|uniref:AAA+ ATPase domain-containing protein n=1 Tax=Diploscapter pachys TaxID=2018661 RepID=A0A2A2KL99_9BILA|nr:hypothetical protein WR25_25649 isoform A [Diploscapter pachys]PAV74652.1 hypothetical protein WR25_25649 isoform B [Diploscapter pachys]